MIDNVVQMTHHVAIIHEELLIKFKNIVVNHQSFVEKIFTTIEPNVYRTIINSFSRLDFVEVSFKNEIKIVIIEFYYILLTNESVFFFFF